MLRAGVLLLLLAAPPALAALSADLSVVLAQDLISPRGNTTLNVSIRSAEAIPGLALEVSAPTAPRLAIDSPSRAVGPMGAGEERYHSFRLVDEGLDPGKYRIQVNATAGGETRSKEVFLTVGAAKTPGFEAGLAALAVAAALGGFKVRRGRKGAG